MNLFGVSIHSQCFCVNGCQIKWPRWSEIWTQYSDWGPHPHPAKWPKWPWRSRGIWKCSFLITIPVSGKETNTWPAWNLVLLGNTNDLQQRWESNTTTISCMVGANCGRHGSRWQSSPNRSCSDCSRLGHPVLWVAVIRGKTDLGQGVRCCIHTVRHHLLGWQTSPTQCQSSEPGWWLAVNCQSHHWRTYWTKKA